jgi:pimeloyl-ACP methyl ester carboxylesterase
MPRSPILNLLVFVTPWSIFITFVCPVLAVSSVNVQEDSKQEDENLDTANATSILEIRLNDGKLLKGKLFLPQDAKAVKALVVFVHGTGPGTYLNHRNSGSKTFNYFDYWGNELNQRGVAFFSYNKRGVTISDQPPYYEKVDRDEFRKVVPHQDVDDLAVIVEQLKETPSLKDAKVSLLGASEGTIIAAMCAEDHPDLIDAILLFGYAHEDMYDIIAWQHSGQASMINLNPVFDSDGDKTISREEYESDDGEVAKYRQRVMQDSKFDLLDANKDGELSAEDFGLRLKTRQRILMLNLKQGNEDWIWDYYFRITVPWLQEHFSLEANKSRLTRLNLPIAIFHGERDANVPVEGVYDLEKRFRALGKTNLKTFVFENHNHDLNFMEWVNNKKIPGGIEKVLEVAAESSR